MTGLPTRYSSLHKIAPDLRHLVCDVATPAAPAHKPDAHVEWFDRVRRTVADHMGVPIDDLHPTSTSGGHSRTARKVLVALATLGQYSIDEIAIYAGGSPTTVRRLLVESAADVLVHGHCRTLWPGLRK